jgi:prevent-host-death family protein
MSAKRVSYRDLRNEPGRVFERLADGEPLELVSDGVPKALLIPIHDGDTAAALDAWKRGEALASLAGLQADARDTGRSSMGLPAITAEIAAARAARRALEEQR